MTKTPRASDHLFVGALSRCLLNRNPAGEDTVESLLACDHFPFDEDELLVETNRFPVVHGISSFHKRSELRSILLDAFDTWILMMDQVLIGQDCLFMVAAFPVADLEDVFNTRVFEWATQPNIIVGYYKDYCAMAIAVKSYKPQVE
jgi:hypothetical protein